MLLVAILCELQVKALPSEPVLIVKKDHLIYCIYFLESLTLIIRNGGGRCHPKATINHYAMPAAVCHEVQSD